jgi:hypothetical protein
MTSPFRHGFVARFSSEPLDDVIALEPPSVWWTLMAVPIVLVQVGYLLFGFTYRQRIDIPARIVSTSADGSALVHVDHVDRLRIDERFVDRRSAWWLRRELPALRCVIISWREAPGGTGWEVGIRTEDERILPASPAVGWLRIIDGAATIVPWRRVTRRIHEPRG